MEVLTQYAGIGAQFDGINTCEVFGVIEFVNGIDGKGLDIFAEDNFLVLVQHDNLAEVLVDVAKVDVDRFVFFVGIEIPFGFYNGRFIIDRNGSLRKCGKGDAEKERKEEKFHYALIYGFNR